MDPWRIEFGAALAAVLLALLVAMMLFRYVCIQALGHGDNQYTAIMRLRNTKPSKKRQKVCNGRASEDVRYPEKIFRWSDHPSLIAEALEYGWAAFAFTYTNGFPSCNLWELCTRCTNADGDNQVKPDIIWEISSSFNYMQKIRMNPASNTPRATVQALQTALPLPGPSVLRFPQESYFEIAIVSEGSEDLSEEVGSADHSDSAKLIPKSPPNSQNGQLNYPNSATTPRCSGVVRSIPNTDNNNNINNNNNTCPRISTECQANIFGMNEKIIAVGHAAFANCMFGRLPGLDDGSVGFHSTGIIFLNGQPHADRLHLRGGWGCVGSVIGCGFNPATTEIFFTLNGECIYRVMSKSCEFGCPLYPTIAANYDVSVLVNFGQDCFQYASANAHRVCDPCSVAKTVGGFPEDGERPISISTAESPCLGRVQDSKGKNADVSSDGGSDLFEIVL